MPDHVSLRRGNRMSYPQIVHFEFHDVEKTGKEGLKRQRKDIASIDRTEFCLQRFYDSLFYLISQEFDKSESLERFCASLINQPSTSNDLLFSLQILYHLSPYSAGGILTLFFPRVTMKLEVGFERCRVFMLCSRFANAQSVQLFSPSVFASGRSNLNFFSLLDDNLKSTLSRDLQEYMAKERESIERVSSRDVSATLCYQNEAILLIS